MMTAERKPMAALARICIVGLLVIGAALGSPLVAISPYKHFKCSGACQEAVAEAPSSAVDSLIKLLLQGTTSASTPEVIKESWTEEAQEPLTAVFLVVVDKAEESNLNILQDFSSAILGSSSTGSSFLGTFLNPDGPDRITADSLKTEYSSAKVRSVAQIEEVTADDGTIETGPVLIITAAEKLPSDFPSTVAKLAATAGNKLALVFVAETGLDDSVGGPDANDKPEDESGMRPPEINSGTVMGLLTALLLLLIFIPGFLCLWSIEGPLAFETAERDTTKKKNL